MKIIDTVIAQIAEHPNTGSSGVLADALASACNSHHKVSLIDASVRLDANSRRLFINLAQITQQPDFSNADQNAALAWLRENKFI